MAVSIDNTFGAGLLGAILTAILYGVTSVQTYLYFVNYPKDPARLKSLVSVIWSVQLLDIWASMSLSSVPSPRVLDTAHVAVVTFSIYHYLVTKHFSLPEHSNRCTRARVLYAPGLHQLVRWTLTPLLVLLVLLHFVFGLETVAWLFIKTTFENFNRSQEVKLAAATPFAIFAVLSDIGVAASLCALLHEGRTGIKKTNAIITTLMIYAVNRCLLTSVVAVTEVIVFIATPDALWYLAIDFVIGKLYANSLLASLNSRNFLRAQQDGNVLTISTHASSRFGPSSGNGGHSQNHAMIALKPMNHGGSISTESEAATTFGSANSVPKVHPNVFDD
ncbi:hypothetical protein E1B28_003589 [Marasmius oreades]|uniref:DUF6534 domain-containing protein n=1 Tax=Marasmius oreades TaxID=181124 RepID=A0A9P7RLX6_9AGAR|nr:uncharacterized protein E1B28_003589 [Marasmius oreades]KAG7086069.1 hypothetical protein E1B28_003589 [Marasmius oreades]